jgi:hypothetical protein
MIFVVSCATNYEDEKSVLMAKNDTNSPVNSFDKNAEQEAVFKTIEGESTKVETPDITSVSTKKDVKSKKNSESKKNVEVANKGKSNPSTLVAPETKAVVHNHLNPILPADYPEEFKAYDEKAKLVWEKFKPVFYQGEESILSVTYLGVTAGYITIQSKEVTTLNNKEVFHYFARFKSSDSYRYFYWLDDRLDSYVDKTTFLPMKYSLIQREKKQDVDDLQLFDFKKMMTYNWYKRVKKDSDKNEKGETKIPSLGQDSFSALQFVRGLPLKKGDVYDFPVITRGKFWLLKVEVFGEETISVNGSDVRAIKIKAETNFPGVLKKSGDIFFWYGANEERRLLKFQAKIKIGSVNGELVEFKPGVKVQ